MLGEGILKGLAETARNFAGSFVSKERMTTVEYPEERLPLPEASRNFPFLVYDGAAREEEPPEVPAEGASRPGIAAVPAGWPLTVRVPPLGAVPPRGVAPFCPALPVRFAVRT